MLTDQELIDEIKAYRPPKKLHPIAGKAWDLYLRDGNKLTDEAINELRVDLQALYGDLKVLTDALCSLSAFVIMITEHKNDPVAGERMGDLMREARKAYEPLGERLATLLQDAAKFVGGTFDKFSDRDQSAKARAPKYDEEPPQGTVPLKNLKPVAQPPAPRKKK